jgi:Fringe-like
LNYFDDDFLQEKSLKMVLISQRHLVRCIKTNFEEFQLFFMHRINQRFLISTSFILGSISGILMTFLMLKISRYDELLQQTTHPVIVTVRDVSENVVDLYDEVRVLCWVLTQPINHKTKAQAVKDTWGKRCNKLVFISTELDENLDILLVNMTEDRRYLWDKTKQGLQHIYKNYGSDYDWYLKADDDTWIFMENLRYFLYSYSPEYPIYFGCKLKRYVEQGYMSGSGYVLSKEAVKRFNEQALADDYKCWNGTEGNEDVEVGKCLANVGVLAGDSRDDLNRHRFNPFPPDGMLRNLFGVSWLDNATFYDIKMVKLFYFIVVLYVYFFHILETLGVKFRNHIINVFLSFPDQKSGFLFRSPWVILVFVFFLSPLH